MAWWASRMGLVLEEFSPEKIIVSCQVNSFFTSACPTSLPASHWDKHQNDPPILKKMSENASLSAYSQWLKTANLSPLLVFSPRLFSTVLCSFNHCSQDLIFLLASLFQFLESCIKCGASNSEQSKWGLTNSKESGTMISHDLGI